MRTAAPATCQREGCGRPATWQPFICAPVVGEPNEAGRVRVEVVAIPIPLVVCTRHKLPKHGWHGLAAPRITHAARRRYGPGLRLDRAWIQHRLLWEAEA